MSEGEGGRKKKVEKELKIQLFRVDSEATVEKPVSDEKGGMFTNTVAYVSDVVYGFLDNSPLIV